MPFSDHFVTVQGRRVGYVDEGRGGAVPLVLLHGGGFDHAELTWRFTVRDLAPLRRVIVPDLPGYGESEGFGGPHDLAALGRWLIAFVDELGLDRVDLAGVSMGGGMALWCGLEHPGRLRRLVPVGAYGLMGRVPLHALAVLVARLGLSPLVYGAVAHSKAAARYGLGATYSRADRISDATLCELQAVARDQGRRRSFDDFLAAELTTAGLRSDLTPRLHGLTVPTLIVHGRADRIVPLRHARRAAALVPGADLLVLDTGHWPMRERPDLFNPALERFLARD